MSKDTIEIERKRIDTLFIPQQGSIVVRQEFGSVVMFIQDKRVELSTITAHKVGLETIKLIQQLDQREIIIFKINGVGVELLPSVAEKVSIALLRKADAADDWQLQYGRKAS